MNDQDISPHVIYKPPPTGRIHDYYGPYPLQELESARAKLIHDMDSMNSVNIRSVKKKCGIMQDGRRVYMRGVNPWLRSSVSTDGGPSTSSGARQKQATESQSVPDLEKSLDESPGLEGVNSHTMDGLDNQQFQGENENASVIQKYKCDLCDVIDDKLPMMLHLEKALHYAASEVLCKTGQNGNLEAFQLIKPTALANSKAKNRSILPCCPYPRCYRTHITIYMCAVHYRQTHNRSETDAYGLAKVLSTKTVNTVVNGYTCQDCGKKFSRLKMLNKHHRDVPAHLPFQQAGENEFLMFTCVTCDVTFDNYFTCMGHVMCSHGHEIEMRSAGVLITYLLKPTSKLQLLSFSKQIPAEERIELDIKNLRRLKKDMGKKERRHLNSEIRELKSLTY